MHTPYDFSIYIAEIVMRKGRKKTKRGRDWPNFLKNLFYPASCCFSGKQKIFNI